MDLGFLWLLAWGPICLYAWYSLEKAKQRPGNETGGSTEGSEVGSEDDDDRQHQVDEYLDMQWWSR